MDKLTTFINIRTDYGFKRLFGTPENKHILVRFLNALLGESEIVTDVVYHDKEMLPPGEDGKRIVYDIYCTSQERKHHFILEMQNIYEPPFEERVLYYTSKIIAGQGKSGWKYHLKPVISIVVTDFDFRYMKKALVHDMRIADLNTGDVLTDKMRIILLSLKHISGRRWEECESELERIMYLIKNMDKLDKNSEIYRCREYQEIFDAAETASMAKEDMVAYSQSLQKLEDTRAGIEYARNESYNEGLAKGRAENQRKSAIKMLQAGSDPEFISQITELSLEEINRLGQYLDSPGNK